MQAPNQVYYSLNFFFFTLIMNHICCISIALCVTGLTEFKYAYVCLLVSNQSAVQSHFSSVKFCTIIIPEMFWNVR